ncbi:hypothetical protein LCGC14_0296100 [marine sediment metagenome]|uniref:Ice-binding protein C-terminal domain-containing protein n=1 Tax=marine sediment metagenome TaxID=412755 RepID=A0A0F9TRZ9_9ZZZZ
MVAQAGAGTRSFVPGDTYVECISYRQLGAGDDFPGMWEYVYDVVGSTAADGQNHAWTRDVYLRGFDGTQIVNQYYSEWAEYTGLTQRWDDHTTEGLSWWMGYQLRTEYPSYWDEVSPGVHEWVLPDPADPNAAWGMINQWHTGDEYAHELSFWNQPGLVDEDGVTWQNASGVTNFQYLAGLLLTFRIVHPYSPGDVQWETWTNYTTGDPDLVSGTTIGPVVEIVSVSLDIKPGSDANSVNLKSMGLLPVVVYGSDELDLTEIDLDTLLLNGVGPRLMPDGSWHVSFEDVDGDLLLDLLVHFEMQALGIEPGMTELALTGVLMDGAELQGADAIRIVPDFNGDLMVNATDLAIMKHSYGTAGVGFEFGDANADGLVDATDLAILKASFGFEAPTGAVPEPATLLVMGCGAIGLFRRRRRP